MYTKICAHTADTGYFEQYLSLSLLKTTQSSRQEMLKTNIDDVIGQSDDND